MKYWHNIRFGSCGVSKVGFGIRKHLLPVIRGNKLARENHHP
jgi:hypothetical protein